MFAYVGHPQNLEDLKDHESRPQLKPYGICHIYKRNTQLCGNEIALRIGMLRPNPEPYP